MKQYTVTISILGSNGNSKTTRVLANDDQEAAEKGLTKLYGKRAGWFRDSGIKTGDYGQVIEPAKTGGSNCITGRARREVYLGW